MSDSKPQDNLIDIRRKMRRIALPLVLGVVVLFAVPIMTAVVFPPNEVAFIANLVLLCTCLLPMLIVLTLLYFGLVVGVFYMARANRAAHGQLNRAYSATLNVTERVHKTNETINRRATDAGTRAARLDVIWDVFQKSNNKKESDLGQRDEH